MKTTYHEEEDELQLIEEDQIYSSQEEEEEEIQDSSIMSHDQYNYFNNEDKTNCTDEDMSTTTTICDYISKKLDDIGETNKRMREETYRRDALDLYNLQYQHYIEREELYERDRRELKESCLNQYYFDQQLGRKLQEQEQQQVHCQEPLLLISSMVHDELEDEVYECYEPYCECTCDHNRRKRRRMI